MNFVLLPTDNKCYLYYSSMCVDRPDLNVKIAQHLCTERQQKLNSK